MGNGKKKSRVEPWWIGPATLACGLITFMILQIILSLALDNKWTLPSPLGLKGEGLFFILLIYIPARRILLFVYSRRMKKKTIEEKD